MMTWEWAQRQRHQWIYRAVGPTTLHLQHEFYLLVALCLLTVSSLHSIYKTSFGIGGDYQFILLTILWLSRHVLLRWLVTSDISTSRSPTLFGVLSHWITSHFMAGQFFDRPNPQVVTKQTGTHASDELRGGPINISSFFLPSILYTWQMANVWIWHPLLQLQEIIWKRMHQTTKGGRAETTGTNSFSSMVSRRERTTANPSVAKAYLIWNTFWTSFGPTLQVVIPAATLSFYLWILFFASDSTNAPLHALIMNPQVTSPSQSQQNLDEFDSKPYGAYKRMERPQWQQVLFFLSCGGTLVSILLYGRVFLPIADLVAGNNVLKSVRDESKLYAGSSSSGKAKSKLQKENMDAPWAEQYKSIVVENRFRLLCKLSFLRIVENIFVCALLPRSTFSCRATGHCSEGPPLWELSKILFFVGIDTTLREDMIESSRFSMLTPDGGSAFMAVLSILMVSGCLLLAQAATLNRSYLGIMGYIAGEWTVLDENDPSIAGNTPSQWDPRRRYKKGDLIVQNYPGFGRQSIYKATSNSPEGRPFDLYLRATHDLFRNELGHAATSNLIWEASSIHIGFMLVLALMIVWYQLMNYHISGLLWTFAANAIAAYGMINTGLPDLSEFEKLAQEIS